MPSRPSLRQYGQVFDAVASEYDKHRSGYPPALVDAALARGRLVRSSRVLEIGCGTGKLTELLASRGLEIDAVDPGANMIDHAQARVGAAPNVRFHVARFEDVALPEAHYDAVFSATAFHWVDPAVSWAKAARHLRDGGLLALLTHVGVTDGSTPGVDDEFRAILERHAPELTAGWGPQMDVERLRAIAAAQAGNVSSLWDAVMYGRHGLAVDHAAQLFTAVEFQLAVVQMEEIADELVAQFRTTSFHARVPPDLRTALEDDYRALVERHGGRVTTSLATVLMTATRAAGSLG